MKIKRKADPVPSTMIVSIGAKVWTMSSKMFFTLVKAAREKYRKDGKNAILAVGRGGVWTMEKTEFRTPAELERGVADIRKSGMDVEYVRT